MISNNTNELLYIDLSKSFLIKNGIAHDYYLNKSTSYTESTLSSQSLNIGASAFGYWNSFGIKVPGAISAASANSTGSQNSSSITYEEKPIVAIPPHAAKIFSEYTILTHHFEDCDLSESPSKKEKASMSFNRATTPISFCNYICYHIGENNINQYIENNFFICEITNQHEQATIHQIETGCPTDNYKTEKNVFIKTSPKEFYIPYYPRSQTKTHPVHKMHNSYDGIYND